jgi:hypothetical protein
MFFATVSVPRPWSTPAILQKSKASAQTGKVNINMQPAQMDTETIKSVLVQGLWNRVNEAENSLKDSMSTNKSSHLAVGTHS